MNTIILDHLRAIYGDAIAVAVAPRLEELLAAHRARRLTLHARAEGLPLTQRDAILITYGDQVSELGRAPLEALADFLDDHVSASVSAVHFVPFYPYSSDDGFSVKDFVAVDPALGTWDNISSFRPHFDLMFDAVFNHMSAQSGWFQKFLADDPDFRDFFVTVEGHPDLSQVVRPRALPLLTEFPSVTGPRKVWTTFSADQVDLNVKNPAVLLRLIEIFLFYIEREAKFIRLDAIAFLWKEAGTSCIHLPQTHRIIQLMRAVLDEVAPHALLITETNVPHVDNISYFGDGTNEAQLVYNFALPPLVLHSFIAGDAGALTRWAQSLKLPSNEVTFFNFLASHDGIGVNPARGILAQNEIDALVARVLAHGGFVSNKSLPDGSEIPYELNINYLDALSNPAGGEPDELVSRKFLTAQAILLSLRGVPGIYFHSLFGSRGHRAGAESSGIKRRINRQKLQRKELDEGLAAAGSLRARVFGGFCALLSMRREHPAFAPDAPQTVLAGDPRVFAVVRQSKDGVDRVLCLHNVSGDEVTVDTEAGAVGLAPLGHRWLELP